MREVHQDETSQVELFLNSVPILASLTRDEKMMLVDALEEKSYAPASRVINQVPYCLSKSDSGSIGGMFDGIVACVFLASLLTGAAGRGLDALLPYRLANQRHIAPSIITAACDCVMQSVLLP